MMTAYKIVSISRGCSNIRSLWANFSTIYS